MVKPKKLWDDLTGVGKVFSWFITPVYYLATFIFLISAVLFYGVAQAWDDFGGV